MSNAWFVVLIVLTSINHTRSEVFTALVDMEKLLHTESELTNFLSDYVQREESRLEKLRIYLNNYKELHKRATQDVERYLQNPINAYVIVKRLSSDWDQVEKLMQQSDDYFQNFTRKKDSFEFPDEEDLSGAAIALMRLQDTYKLDTSALARGEIGSSVHTVELDAGDCFELGRQAYNNGDHYHTVLWMQEALERLENESNKSIDRPEVLEYLAYSTFMQGNVRHALKLTVDLLEAAPLHPRAAGNRIFYEETIMKDEQKKRGDDGATNVDSGYVEKNQDVEVDSERIFYEKLCRGEHTAGFGKTKSLSCRYFSNGNPWLLLQPMKEEEMSSSPRIVIYYDAMSDTEMRTIKEIASPRLRRATVQNYKSGELEVAAYRISKSSWLKSEDHEVVAQVNRRIQALTGLTMDTAEELQVVNYGIGGHYEPHFDFARREETNAFKSLGTGNRIATVLFYMSDVDAGGATVFPSIGIALKPIKGAAAFWYNLHKNGEGDILTRHAACPVLAGSKWVSNKWIHERGQEFRRQCGIKFND